ncbi:MULTISPECIES: hypothetical protein [Amycolatopsis]|uniref:hypothetical protein n=1 Tax=Amycolatopsis TaxID=1813 RepID=UPI00174D438B|nr:hypothetical protein [Amycolatopsis bullii]
MTHAVGPVLSPVTETATALVWPVVRSTLPVIEPLTRAAKALLSPVTGAVAVLVEPVFSAVDAPVADLAGALTSVVKPAAGSASPVVTGLLAPVDDDAGRSVLAPLARAVEASATAGPVVRAVFPAAVPVTGPPAPRPTPVLEKAARVVAPGCSATVSATGPRRGTAHHSAAQLGGPRRGEAPVYPGAPGSSSDVASGGGSPLPPAFLTAGHAPHHLRASTGTHGVFVPLWRPSEPGTGPG